jgi:hypothetical protein
LNAIVVQKEAGLLTREHTQESLSIAYVHALAGKAGVNVNIRETHDYGVDGMFRQIANFNGRRVATGTAVDFQLKATVRWEHRDAHVIYDLDADAFNNLVARTHGIYFVLILLCLPTLDADWLASTESQLVLRNCCYWYKPEGQALTENTSTKRVHIPRTNLLTAESIQDLLRDARVREMGL